MVFKMNDNQNDLAAMYEDFERWSARISTLIMTSCNMDRDEMKHLLQTLQGAAKTLTPARVQMQRRADANCLRGNGRSWSDTPMG